MTEPQPTEATVTIASQSIELALTGKPDVKNKWGAGSIRPAFVVFTYLPEGIRAHLYGVWVREDGELTDAPCDQDYRIGDTDEWPDWMAELARNHRPATPPPAADRVALSAKLWQIAEHHIVAEWICCEPLEPGHTLCAKGYAALGMAKTLLVDSPEAWNPNAPLLDAVLAMLPVSADRAAVLREAADAITEVIETDRAYSPRRSNDRAALGGAREIVLNLIDKPRRMADEAQQPEAPAVDRLARIREWVTSDVVTAHSEFGSGYREAQRDIRDLLDGRPTESAAAQQPKEEA